MSFSVRGLPEYHKGMLIVGLQPSMGRFWPGADPGVIAASFDTPAISAMVGLSRRGMIKRVIPLSSASPGDGLVPVLASSAATIADSEARYGGGGARVAAALGATASQKRSKDANAGVCIVELDSEGDEHRLRDELANDPDVTFAARVPVRYASVRRPRRSKVTGATPTAIPPAGDMWNLARIGWSEARGLPDFKDATKIKVAVLDTGIDEQHPDLVGRIAGYVHTYAGVSAPSGPEDVIGHGTHVAGTICANFDNVFGVRGIASCALLAWKIFDDEPDLLRVLLGPDEYVYYVDPVMYRRALSECLDAKVDVVNLSIGGPGEPDPQERQLFDLLVADGVTVVAAMGNERSLGSPISYPAAIPGVIGVGATTINDRVADFSNRGGHISIAAPGVGIWSTLPTYPGQTGFVAATRPDGTSIPGAPKSRDTNYASWQGTSMASPHVAAAAALVLANKGRMPGGDVRTALMNSADPVPGMGGAAFHPDYGAGRLNLVKLLG
ncbi:S8 family serine peptidase [Mesorhizobium sp. M0965]|uniref:S8 family peptidase n=1 Tax=unclassified Mesorhizobium TaxID=325217 RepID=UPI00333AA0FE